MQKTPGQLNAAPVLITVSLIAILAVCAAVGGILLDDLQAGENRPAYQIPFVLTLVSGFCVLARIASLLEPPRLTKNSGLAGALLKGLGKTQAQKRREALKPVLHPFSLAMLIPAVLYGFWRLATLTVTDFDLESLAGLCLLTTVFLIFWMVQTWAQNVKSARTLLCLSIPVTVFSFLYASMKADIEWNAFLPAASSSALIRMNETGLPGTCLIAVMVAASFGLSLYALTHRHRHRNFAWMMAGLALLIVLADFLLPASPALWIFWLSAWTGLGACWAQAWPKARKRYLLFEA